MQSASDAVLKGEAASLQVAVCAVWAGRGAQRDAKTGLNYRGEEIEEVACEAQAKAEHHNERCSAQLHVLKRRKVREQAYGEEYDVGRRAYDTLSELECPEGSKPEKQATNRPEYAAGEQGFPRGGQLGQARAHDKRGRGAQGERDGERAECALESASRVHVCGLYDAQEEGPEVRKENRQTKSASKVAYGQIPCGGCCRIPIVHINPQLPRLCDARLYQKGE